MNLKNLAAIGTLALLASGGALISSPRLEAAQTSDAEELTRGPVHEAFANSVSYNPEPGIIVKVAPPKMIDEIPPDQRPDGDNVSWIPGYWGWDEDQNDFLWISGIWRNLPPGRQWVPGYWADLQSSQWQWTSGYWADEQTQEVSYYEKPPKSIETGPNVESPGDNYVWISGNWMYRDDRYAWRPGYWEPAQENWVWVPAHYQWTPRGYVFVDGYWDYDVQRRGVVFAPVRFRHEVYDRPDYYYTPSTVIVVNVFLSHLFVRPSYGHYYFGDYYAPRYRNSGYYAPYAYQAERRGYDPIYVYNRWEHRGDRDWDRRRRDDFDFYRDNEKARPAHTLAALLARPENERRGKRDNFDFARSLKDYAEDKDSGRRFRQVDKKERDNIVEQRQEMRKFRDDRQQIELRGRDKARPGKEGDPVQAVREKFSRSPVVAKKAEDLAGKEAPPKRPEAREPDRRDLRPGPDGDRKDGRPDQAGKEGMPGAPGREGRDGPGPDAKKPGEDIARGDKERPDRGPRDGKPGAPDLNPNAKDRPDMVPPPNREPGKREQADGKEKTLPKQVTPPDTAKRPDRPMPDKVTPPETAKRPEVPQMPKREDRREPSKPTPQKITPPETAKRPEVRPEVRREPKREAPEPSAPAKRTPAPEPQRKIERPRPAPEAPKPEARRPQQVEPQRKPEPKVERPSAPQQQQKAPQQRQEKPDRGDKKNKD